mgnify:CR=1 FL=1
MPTKEKRYGVSINLKAADAIKRVQAQIEREIGFTPSMSQVVEYLAIQYMKQDKLTGGQHV